MCYDVVERGCTLPRDPRLESGKTLIQIQVLLDAKFI